MSNAANDRRTQPRHDPESQLILEALRNNRMRTQTLLDELKRRNKKLREEMNTGDRNRTQS